MGPIIAILSYVTRIYTKLISLMQKASNPAYNPDTDSNEAISEAVTGVLQEVTGISNDTTSIRRETFSLTRSPSSGTVLLNNTTQWIYTHSDNRPFMFGGGTIDLSQLQAGDKVIVYESAAIHPDGATGNVSTVKLTGPLGLNSLIQFNPMYNQYGVAFGVRQVAGTYRTVKHEWFHADRLE